MGNQTSTQIFSPLGVHTRYAKPSVIVPEPKNPITGSAIDTSPSISQNIISASTDNHTTPKYFSDEDLKGFENPFGEDPFGHNNKTTFPQIGSRENASYFGDKDMYRDADGTLMKKNLWSPDSKATFADFDTLQEAQANGLGIGITPDKFDQLKLDSRVLDNRNLSTYANLGLGGAQLGLGLFSTFGPNGSMAMNKKNMKLMDSQIANNKDIMDRRSANSENIKKYFG